MADLNGTYIGSYMAKCYAYTLPAMNQVQQLYYATGEGRPIDAEAFPGILMRFGVFGFEAQNQNDEEVLVVKGIKWQVPQRGFEGFLNDSDPTAVHEPHPIDPCWHWELMSGQLVEWHPTDIYLSVGSITKYADEAIRRFRARYFEVDLP